MKKVIKIKVGEEVVLTKVDEWDKRNGLRVGMRGKVIDLGSRDYRPNRVSVIFPDGGNIPSSDWGWWVDMVED